MFSSFGPERGEGGAAGALVKAAGTAGGRFVEIPAPEASETGGGGGAGMMSRTADGNVSTDQISWSGGTERLTASVLVAPGEKSRMEAEEILA